MGPPADVSGLATTRLAAGHDQNYPSKKTALDSKVAITPAQFYLFYMLQRDLPAGFIVPCLPTKTDKLPSGEMWLHEIKHDGFRAIARKSN